MNWKKLYHVIPILIFICMILLAVLYLPLRRQERICQTNPLIYGAKQYYDRGVEVTCTCKPLNLEYKYFVFDHKNIYVDEVPLFSFNSERVTERPDGIR